MPSVSRQSIVIAAIDAADLGRKWWAAELGTHATTLSQWAHDERPMPAELCFEALAVLSRVRPELAADAMRELARPIGLTVEPIARRPLSSSRTHVRLQREAADVQGARADADEDGRRDAVEIRRERREAGEALAAAEDHVAALDQELADAEEREGVARLPLRAAVRS